MYLIMFYLLYDEISASLYLRSAYIKDYARKREKRYNDLT